MPADRELTTWRAHPDSRADLEPLFAEDDWPRPCIDAVLEGVLGVITATAGPRPCVARLDVQDFSIFAGSSSHPAAPALARARPRPFLGTGPLAWLELVRQLRGEAGEASTWCTFTLFSNQALDRDRLQDLSERLPPESALLPLDADLARRAWDEVRSSQPGHAFHSDEDLLAHGLGYCVLCGDRVASVASSFATSRRDVEIQIDTHPGYQRRGLACAASAALIRDCLDRGLRPHWSAANPHSVGLAGKLGFTAVGRRQVLDIPK